MTQLQVKLFWNVTSEQSQNLPEQCLNLIKEGGGTGAIFEYYFKRKTL